MPVSTNESAWQVGKPVEEVTACATCHGKAENTCDGCHTRHEFSAAEASKLRRFSELEKKVEIEHKAYEFWKHGEYTDLLLGWKRKEGDVKEK